MSSTALPDKSLPFHLFMLEYGHEEFNRGRILPYHDLRAEALPRWNHIPKGKREEYKEKAMKNKDQIINDIESLWKHDAKVAQKKREEMEAKNKRIKEYLQAKKKLDIKSEIFILADVNIFLKVKEDVYPAELALSKFSLSKGIIETIHFHIDLDTRHDLPQGLLNTAKMTSEDTHQIPLSPDPRQGKFIRIDQAEAKNQLVEFLSTDTIMFSQQEPLLKYDVTEVVELTFMKVLELPVIVAPLQEIFRAMKNEVRYYEMDNNKLLMDNPLESIGSLGCMHHFVVDGPKFCSLARVKRWAHHLCKLVLPNEDLKPEHLPVFKQPEEYQLIFGFSEAVAAKANVEDLAELPSALYAMNQLKIDKTPKQENTCGSFKENRDKDTGEKNFTNLLEMAEKDYEEFSEADLSYFIDDEENDDTLTVKVTDTLNATIYPEQMAEIDRVLAKQDDNSSSFDATYFDDDDIKFDTSSVISFGNSRAFTDNFETCSTIAADDTYSEFDFEELAAA